MRKGLVLAMEDDEIVGGDENSQVEIAENAAELSEVVASNSEEVAAVEALIVSIEEAEAEAGVLEEIQEKAEDSLSEDGAEGEGMSEDAAEVAEVAIEAIRNKLGLPQRVFPATEQFGSRNSRKAATRIAIEGIGDAIKRVWEAIKKAVKSIYQKIADFFQRFFDNTERVTKQAKALRDVAYKLKGKKAEKEDITDASLAALFNDPFTGNFAAETVLKQHLGWTKGSVKLLETLGNTGNIIDKLIKKDAKTSDLTAIGKSFLDLAEVAKQCMVSPRTHDNKDGDNKVHYIVDGPYIGGQQLEMAFRSDKKTGDFVSVSVHFGDSTIEKKDKEPKKDTFKAMTPDKMVEQCDSVIQLMKDTEEYKKKSGDIQKIGLNAIKVVDGVMNIADTIADNAESNSDIKAVIANIKEAITGVANAGGRLAMMTPAWNVKMGNALLRYVSKSQSLYKKS